MSIKPEEVTKTHNDGERDSKDGKYNPPDITPSFFHPVMTQRQIDEEWERRDAYNKGRENDRKNRG